MAPQAPAPAAGPRPGHAPGASSRWSREPAMLHAVEPERTPQTVNPHPQRRASENILRPQVSRKPHASSPEIIRPNRLHQRGPVVELRITRKHVAAGVTSMRHALVGSDVVGRGTPSARRPTLKHMNIARLRRTASGLARFLDLFIRIRSGAPKARCVPAVQMMPA